MIQAILASKWMLLGVLEVAAWSVTFAMLYVRYKLRSARWFRIFTVLFFLTGVIPQVLLGVLNFLAAGKVDVFTLVIVLLLVYGSTLGKRQVQRLDGWAKKKFS